MIQAQPAIFNSAHGAQVTSRACPKPWLAPGVLISRDGRGRVFDTMGVERLWRRVKSEAVSRKDDRRVPEVMNGVQGSLACYNRERIHPSLTYQMPAALYRQGPKGAAVTTVN